MGDVLTISGPYYWMTVPVWNIQITGQQITLSESELEEALRRIRCGEEEFSKPPINPDNGNVEWQENNTRTTCNCESCQNARLGPKAVAS